MKGTVIESCWAGAERAAAVGPRARFPAAPGDGVVEFAFVRGKTALRSMRSTYPLKMMHLRGAARTPYSSVQRDAPDQELPGAEWVYMLGHGGGVVSGDLQRVRVGVDAGCTAVLTTQSFTKVYHHHQGQVSRQYMRADIGSSALLVVLPDPVVPFRHSRFVQHQDFELQSQGGPSTGEESGAEHCCVGGSLVLVDWLTSGRRARGESWEMDRYESVNRVCVGGQCVLHDAVQLSRDPRTSSVKQRMLPFHCLAMVALIGPRTSALAEYLRELVRARQTERIVDEEGEGTPFVGGKRRRHPGVCS